MKLIKPNWPAPKHVVAFSTTRSGGVSKGPFQGLNLGLHVSDLPSDVQRNRSLLQQELGLTQPLAWLNQVHSNICIEITKPLKQIPDVDGSWTRKTVLGCVVMTADCLPILFTDEQGSFVAAIHAGWRGLQSGIIEHTLTQINASPEQVLVWLGPAISQAAFQVGEEVKQAFEEHDADASQAFIADTEAGKWRADLYALAKMRLQRLGVTQVYGGDYCTFNEPERFYSYRRQSMTGRMASVIYLEK
ncbi:peptidoglycan editing factor PgeF [Motilimonas pumila]|uniref:Purine nucleoside phosphorylase n=1 Tax=Motilimonas pumila TaxID=2303987 RepID=A0A418YAF6_9GAMM|nr:peptidoglycan editing factor PgeF [Motilimonas pumila]RJG39506.1 peptidoglycan editing factor PgeF [Motilimonas pumila]